MQGVIGLALIVIAAIFIYDVVAGKSQAIISLISGQQDIYQEQGTKQGGPPLLSTVIGTSTSSTVSSPVIPVQPSRTVVNPPTFSLGKVLL